MFRGKPITLLAGAALPATVLAVAAFGGGASAATTTPSATNGAPAAVTAASRTVNVRRTGLGKVLVDSRGHTLYLFKKDSRGKSRCSGACATFWPPLLKASGKPTVGSGARASMVGTIRRSDGKRQVTYNGHPLYRFEMDTTAGQTHGEGVDAFGARWFVVSPAGKQISG
jgi:predicted lipoprotein with Yx(FWY)xxD motif